MGLELKANPGLPEEWQRNICETSNVDRSRDHSQDMDIRSFLEILARPLARCRRAYDATMEWVLVARRIPHLHVKVDNKQVMLRQIVRKISFYVFNSREDEIWDTCLNEEAPQK